MSINAGHFIILKRWLCVLVGGVSKTANGYGTYLFADGMGVVVVAEGRADGCGCFCLLVCAWDREDGCVEGMERVGDCGPGECTLEDARAALVDEGCCFAAVWRVCEEYVERVGDVVAELGGVGVVVE